MSDMLPPTVQFLASPDTPGPESPGRPLVAKIPGSHPPPGGSAALETIAQSLFRGCYELWLRSDSMRACRTESLTQVTFPTKNGRLSPLTWRSLEKTLPSAPTICERFSTA